MPQKVSSDLNLSDTLTALPSLPSLRSLPPTISLQIGFLKSSSKDSVRKILLPRVLSSLSPSRLHILERHRLSAHHLCVPGVQCRALQTLHDPQTCTNHHDQLKRHNRLKLPWLGLPEVTVEVALPVPRATPSSGTGLLWLVVSAALEDSDRVRSYAGITG